LKVFQKFEMMNLLKITKTSTRAKQQNSSDGIKSSDSRLRRVKYERTSSLAVFLEGARKASELTGARRLYRPPERKELGNWLGVIT
jgi:hypothetical protein